MQNYRVSNYQVIESVFAMLISIDSIGRLS